MNLLDIISTKPASAMSDAELDAAISEAEYYRKLFAGLASGITLWDAVLCKFARRDPLAIEFMRSHTVTA